MAYSGDLITIGGLNCRRLVKEYTIERAKLWKNASRNMAGNITATLIGIFPKISITTRNALTESEVAALDAVLDRDYFNVTYFDPKYRTQRTARFYANDYENSMLEKKRGLYKSFEFHLIAVSKEA